MSNLLRTAVYIWLAFESFVLYYVYSQGYERIKKSPIINSLTLFFLVLALYFAYLAFMPVAVIFGIDITAQLTHVIILFLIPVVYFMRRFRRLSMKEDEMRLPEEPKKNE